MSIRQVNYAYDMNQFEPVIARSRVDMRAARYTMIDAGFVQLQQGEIRNYKILRPGFFAGSIPGSMRSRVLPRSYATAPVAANAVTMTVRDCQIFAPGDVLSIIAPSARFTVASAATGWAVNDTLTATINGVATTITVLAGDIAGTLTQTNLNLAIKMLAAIKANNSLIKRVDGVAGASTGTDAMIILWAYDFKSPYTFTAADTGANGTATASAATFAPNTTIGTVSGVTVPTNTLVISAAAVSLLPGLPIGVATSSPEMLGLLQPNTPLDLSFRESMNFALYTDDLELYAERLPYWDGQIELAYPGLMLV